MSPAGRPEGADRPDEIVVEAVLAATQPHTLMSTRLVSARLDFGGIPGDRHHGLTIRSSSREAAVYARNTEIRNRRQLTIVSVEECACVASRLGLDRLDPEWLGANLLVRGYPLLSSMPVGTRLLFPGGAALVAEGGNAPCRHPGEIVQHLHPGVPGLVKGFVREAYGRRGIIASVDRPGEVRAGNRVRVLPAPVYATIT